MMYWDLELLEISKLSEQQLLSLIVMTHINPPEQWYEEYKQALIWEWEKRHAT